MRVRECVCVRVCESVCVGEREFIWNDTLVVCVGECVCVCVCLRERVCVESVCVWRECVGGYSIEEGPGRRFDDKHRRRFTVTGTATRCEHLARE